MNCSAEGCDQPTIARTMCSRHYQQWKRLNPGQTKPSERGIPAIDRLLSRCVEDNGCWIYTGATGQGGYVRLRGPKAGSPKVFGHRLAYEYFISDIPEGLSYDHLCRTPSCVNPWHGEPVPLKVNNDRAPGNISNLNAAKTHCPQGHPLSGDNLRFASQGRGRVCKACRSVSNRKYRSTQRTMA